MPPLAILRAAPRPQAPDDLLAHACLRIADRPWRLQGRSGTVQVAVQGPVTANNVGLLHRLAQRDGGIVSLPTVSVEPDVAAGRLVAVLPDWRPPAVVVHAVTETKLLPAKVRVFVECLTNRLKFTAVALP